ncbi:hypothetical protein K450DRAFT_255672 [Umbelopsis ramanniana AG]|uniref:Uncharacterized protein n=1 Tax=Umbelopsis ramanniana AG TaxID=1314678 RepID=A0AAD5E5G1_UMBRA|nr:uncharacterized protein K450DRAFT_255672 [Umbelopsis ramanniana AG]KAI8576686.1 hypothetical protein K450DRAFT_255672 [Umbelopsis ramanniana AG]
MTSKIETQNGRSSYFIAPRHLMCSNGTDIFATPACLFGVVLNISLRIPLLINLIHHDRFL